MCKSNNKIPYRNIHKIRIYEPWFIVIVPLWRLTECFIQFCCYFRWYKNTLIDRHRRENAMATEVRHRGEGKIFYVIYYRVGLTVMDVQYAYSRIQCLVWNRSLFSYTAFYVLYSYQIQGELE